MRYGFRWKSAAEKEAKINENFVSQISYTSGYYTFFDVSKWNVHNLNAWKCRLALNPSHTTMLSHYSYEGSTPTWTPVDENDESADQWRRTVINYLLLITSIFLVVYILFGSFDFHWMSQIIFKSEYLLQKLESLETHELVNFLRCELKLSRDLISVLYNQISSYDAAYKEMQEKILLITESFEKKEKDLEKKIISLQNSPGKTAMMNSDNISTSLNKMITIKKLNFTIREQTKLLSIYEANIADMLQEIDELCHDTTSKAVQAEQIAMSLEDCKCSIIQLVERLHNETRELQKLREDSANAAKMTAMKVKDINLKVFNAISERNHWKKKVGVYMCEYVRVWI